MHADTGRGLPSLKQTFPGSDDAKLYGDRAGPSSNTATSMSARMGTAWASPASLRDAPGVMTGAQTARAPQPWHGTADTYGKTSLYVSPPRQPPPPRVPLRTACGEDGTDGGAVAADTAVRGNGTTRDKPQRLESIRQFLMANGARHIPEGERNAAVRKALADVVEVFPQLGSVMMPVSNYLRDVTTLSGIAEREHAEALEAREKAVYDKVESFFEEKTLTLLRDKKRLESAVASLQQQVVQLRKERDEDLEKTKREVMRRLNDSEQKEDEFRSFRQLIAAVYKTNEQLTNRIDQLEAILKKHRLDIPPASSELYAFRSSADGRGSAADPAVRPLNAQVTAQFIAASQEEMDNARLNLQRELITNAFDDRTAYRLQVSSLKSDKLELQAKVSTLEERVLELNRYIYEKRFLTSYGDTDGPVPLTPRPRDVPFGIQTDLGIDLKHSTAEIVSELSSVGTNLKHQLNSSLLRLRQMATVTDWMQENSLTELDVEYNGASVLPTYAVAMWPLVPHFLRTTVSPDVTNLRWSEAETGALFLQLFRSLNPLRESCRQMRDDKMVEPRRYQLFERREHVMARLDATREDMKKSAENVPFGYIVSCFIREYLMALNPGSKEATLVLPGTLQPRYTVSGDQRPVELEFTRFAYNMWWAAQRYRDTQPLCRYFLAIVDGALPPSLFDVMEELVDKVKALVQALDVDGSRLMTFQKLATGTAHVVTDMGAQAGRCGVLAIAQTFEQNEVPLLAGRIRMEALIADETCAVLEPTPGEELTALAAAARQQRGLPPRITVCRVPGRTQQPPGASVYMRFWRRLVLQRYEQLYAYVEGLLGPLVVESDVVVGLYFLPLPETMALLQHLDDEYNSTPGTLFRNNQFPSFPEDRTLLSHDGVAHVFQEAVSGLPEITKNYLSLLRERGQVVASRDAYRVATLRELVQDTLDGLPRLSRSVHFPFKDAAEAARGNFYKSTGSPLSQSSPKFGRPVSSTEGNGVSPATKDRAGSPDGLATAAPSKPTKATKTKKKAASKAVRKVKTSFSRTTHSASDLGRAVAGQRNTPTPDAIPSALLIDDDCEMVEWYGFCAALRQCVPPLNDRLLKMEMQSPDWSSLLEGLRGQLRRESPEHENENHNNAETDGEKAERNTDSGITTGHTRATDV